MPQADRRRASANRGLMPIRELPAGVVVVVSSFVSDRGGRAGKAGEGRAAPNSASYAVLASQDGDLRPGRDRPERPS
jgi:hypothetical protein